MLGRWAGLSQEAETADEAGLFDDESR